MLSPSESENALKYFLRNNVYLKITGHIIESTFEVI